NGFFGGDTRRDGARARRGGAPRSRYRRSRARGSPGSAVRARGALTDTVTVEQLTENLRATAVSGVELADATTSLIEPPAQYWADRRSALGTDAGGMNSGCIRHHRA